MNDNSVHHYDKEICDCRPPRITGGSFQPSIYYMYLNTFFAFEGFKLLLLN